MRSVIQQSVVLAAAADRLFGMYLDPMAHATITGYPVEIAAEPGASFSAFGGQLSGTILAVVRPRLVVQSWRSTKFRAEDQESTLVLQFASDGSSIESGRIDLVQVDVPEHDYQDVIDGWQKYYWSPWKTYLERQ